MKCKWRVKPCNVLKSEQFKQKSYDMSCRNNFSEVSKAINLIHTIFLEMWHQVYRAIKKLRTDDRWKSLVIWANKARKCGFYEMWVLRCSMSDQPHYMSMSC